MTLLVPQAEGIPLPRPTGISRPFWEACAEGRLTYMRCDRCDAVVFNPAPICPACRSRELAWHESGGTGSIYSYTIVHRPMTPKFVTPYVPIIVDVDEGFQMVSNLIGCEPEVAAVGLRVHVEMHAIGSVTLPYFVPLSPTS